MKITEMRKVVSAPVLEPQHVLGDADEARGEAAEGVRTGGPLGHRRQRDPRERDAERGADRERDDDPQIARDLGVQQRADHRDRHADDAGQHAAPGGLGAVQPAQREDEQRRRDRGTRAG
jgi:hypothetical protein